MPVLKRPKKHAGEHRPGSPDRQLAFPSERRAHVRLPQRDLRCNLGDVVDLSRGGMRVRCRTLSAPSGLVRIMLKTEHELISLIGMVVHSRRRGLFSREIGVQFTEAHPDVIERLHRISLAHQMEGARDVRAVKG